jgi:hypothetical protein
MTIQDGILIGAAGGACAGITVWLVQVVCTWVKDQWHKRRVYEWMKRNTANERGKQYRSTRAIASWNNLTEDRTRYICSVDKRIFLSTGEKEDMWSIYERGDRSVYEKSGIETV